MPLGKGGFQPESGNVDTCLRSYIASIVFFLSQKFCDVYSFHSYQFRENFCFELHNMHADATQNIHMKAHPHAYMHTTLVCIRMNEGVVARNSRSRREGIEGWPRKRMAISKAGYSCPLTTSSTQLRTGPNGEEGWLHSIRAPQRQSRSRH